MTELNRSWIKPGIYHLDNVTDFKIENTQEYHDNLVVLKQKVLDSTGLNNQKGFEYQTMLYNLWESEGEEAPSWTHLWLHQWSDDNYSQFLNQTLKWSKDHQKNGSVIVQKQLQFLLLRDQAITHQQMLREVTTQLKKSEKSVVTNQSNVETLLSEVGGHEILIEDIGSKLNGFQRLQEISRSIHTRAQQLMTRQKINRQRLVKVNLEQEALRIATPKASKTGKTTKQKSQSEDLSL